MAGPLPGILTLLFDAGKGALAVLLAAHFTNHNSTSMMLAALFALIGHCYPVWLRFKGGKGVATGLGVFTALCPFAGLGSLAVFIIVVITWRYASLGSIAAAASMPLLVYFFWAPGHAPPLVIVFGTLFATSLVIYKHDANLQRLVQGTEPRFGSDESDKPRIPHSEQNRDTRVEGRGAPHFPWFFREAVMRTKLHFGYARPRWRKR